MFIQDKLYAIIQSGYFNKSKTNLKGKTENKNQEERLINLPRGYDDFKYIYVEPWDSCAGQFTYEIPSDWKNAVLKYEDT